MIKNQIHIGTHLKIRSSGCRVLTMSWWFFALIMISSYKANRTSFLTVNRFDESPINSVEDLAIQKNIKYGLLLHGSTFDYFRVRHKKNKTHCFDIYLFATTSVAFDRLLMGLWWNFLHDVGVGNLKSFLFLELDGKSSWKYWSLLLWFKIPLSCAICVLFFCFLCGHFFKWDHLSICIYYRIGFT